MNSTEAEEVIRRLRAELDAANARLSNLEQIPGSQGAPAPREFPLAPVENLPTPAGGSGAPDGSNQAPANPPISSGEDKPKETFTISDDEGAPRGNTLHTKQNNTQEAAAAATPTELPPAGRTLRATSANKTTPRDEIEQPAGGSVGKKRGAKPAQTADFPTHHGGAAAVHQPGPRVSQPSAGAPKPPGASMGTPKTPGANTHLDVPRPAISANVQGAPSHDDHVAALIKFWPHGDAVSALAQTMSEDGKEDLNQAHDLLMRQRDSRIAAAMEREKERAPGKGSRDDEAKGEAIREGGELAVFIAGAPDAIMVVLHLVKVHKMLSSGHNAASERTAANLIANPMIQCFSDLTAVSNTQLRKIAMAVVHDCRECEDLRIREAARKVEEKRQAEEAEARRVREAETERRRLRTLAERTREQEEAERAQRRRQQRTPPLGLIDDRGQSLGEAAFKDSDAKWAKNKRAQDCHECGRGYLGSEARLLFMCDVCDKCYHKRCTLWVKVVHRDADPRSDDYSFACNRCANALPPMWRLHDRTHDDRAPDDQGQDRGPRDGDRDGEVRGGRATATPPLQSPRRHQAPPLPSGESTILNLSQSTHQGANAGNEGRLSYKIDKYFEWKAPPSDWDILKTHPECGMSEPAYRNWKATNISRRDQAGGALGPLTNAIREDMLPSVGSVLLTNPAMKGGRTDAQVSEWLKSDPSYKWVKNVSDVDLLRTIDKHYCILDHEPFVAMKFGSASQGYHPTTADGDTNYFASAFSAFSDKWLNALKDLRTGGWDDANRDLKQTFVNALEAQPTLHREASTYKTDCHEILIAYMRSWCILRETDVKKNAKTRAEATAARTSTDTSAKSPGGDKQMEKYERQIKVLRTEIGALRAQGGAAASDRPTVARYPSTIDPKTQWYCHGCGKTYSKDGRPIPCERQCVYSEHAEHNSYYLKGKAWPTDKNPLSWGTAEGYKARFHQEMPPTGKKFLELRAKYASQNARKRERPTETNP